MAKKQSDGSAAAPKADEQRVTLELPCALTDAEVDERRLQLVEKLRLIKEAKAHEEDLKLQVKQAKDATKARETELWTIERVVFSRKEVRPVLCTVELVGSTVQTVRTDTGAVVATRAATSGELQGRLPLVIDQPTGVVYPPLEVESVALASEDQSGAPASTDKAENDALLSGMEALSALRPSQWWALENVQVSSVKHHPVPPDFFVKSQSKALAKKTAKEVEELRQGGWLALGDPMKGWQLTPRSRTALYQLAHFSRTKDIKVGLFPLRDWAQRELLLEQLKLEPRTLLQLEEGTGLTADSVAKQMPKLVELGLCEVLPKGKGPVCYQRVASPVEQADVVKTPRAAQ